MAGTIRLGRFSLSCSVLGPGRRGVVWVQGCGRNCPGCVAPQTHDFSGGFEMCVSDLADIYLARTDIEGLTFSGGEPMDQAGALSDLVTIIRSHGAGSVGSVGGEGLSFLCYTGYQYKQLLDSGTADQKRLLGLLDVLVDGPYIQSRHGNLLWRGSDNQSVYFLTDRYEEYKDRLDEPSQGLEFEFDQNGVPQWSGIPPEGFLEEYYEKMRSWGIEIIP